MQSNIFDKIFNSKIQCDLQIQNKLINCEYSSSNQKTIKQYRQTRILKNKIFNFLILRKQGK